MLLLGLGMRTSLVCAVLRPGGGAAPPMNTAAAPPGLLIVHVSCNDPVESAYVLPGTPSARRLRRPTV
jgi:hypothetical protein